MKQEEAIAAALKENEAIATAAHKAAAAEALAAGHPGVKVSMSQPGISDGGLAIKRQRTIKANGVARRRNTKSKMEEMAAAAAAAVAAVSAQQPGLNNLHTHDSSSFYHSTPTYSHTAGPSNNTSEMLSHETMESTLSDPQVDLHLVQQAMQAAAGQMDELEMGMQIPIEMQLHGDHDDGYQFEVGVGVGVDGVEHNRVHPYTPHGGQGFDPNQYGYTGQDGVFGGFGQSQ
jgi:hypothetical protein